MTYDADYYAGKGSGYVLSYRIMRLPLLWRQEHRHILRFIKSGDALDVGCAYGYFLATLPEGFVKHGVDLSEHAIAQARALHGAPERFRVCDASVEVPFAGKTFDLVTCFNVLEHFEDPRPALANIAEAVKPGGLFYARLPFRHPPMCRDRYHHYRPAEEWLRLFSEWFDVELESYVFTIWGKLSDIPAPRSLANFMAVMLRRR